MRQTQYGYVYVLAATCAETGQAEGLISPRLDTGIVNLFLAQFSATLAPDVQAVLVWDGAGYPSGERSTLPVEHHVDELAAVLTGAESSRESVALPAEPSLVEPKIRHRG